VGLPQAAKKKQQDEEAVKKQEQEVRPCGRRCRQWGRLPVKPGRIVAFKARPDRRSSHVLVARCGPLRGMALRILAVALSHVNATIQCMHVSRAFHTPVLGAVRPGVHV
jgi:hypothetical protein